jgi:hypothetical protein
MKGMRAWLAAGVAWLAACSGVERLLPGVQMGALAHAFAACSPLLLIGVPQLGRARRSLCVGGALVGYVAAKALLLGSLDAMAPSVTLVELVAVGGAVLIWHRLAGLLGEFREAVVRMTLGAQVTSLAAFETAQSDLYREVRRSRRYRRPLTVLAIQAEGATESPPNRLLEQIQRENAERYAAAQLARLLAEETKDCDVVATRGVHLLSMLAETTREDAERIIERVAVEARERYGLALRVGIAGFPDEEVTFDGLVTRAEEGMRSATPLAAPPQQSAQEQVRRIAGGEVNRIAAQEIQPGRESGEGTAATREKRVGPLRAGGSNQ